MKAIFEFGLLPSEKLKESYNEIGNSVNSEKCYFYIRQV